MTDINESKRALLAHYEDEQRELTAIVTRLRRELGIAADVKGSRLSKLAVAAEPTSAFHERSPIYGLGGLTDPTALVKPGDFFGMTQMAATRGYMERTNKQTVTVQEIGIALFRGKAVEEPIEGTVGLRNLSSMLSRSKDFVNVARGRWGLAEWYPNRPAKRGKKSNDEPAVTSERGKGKHE